MQGDEMIEMYNAAIAASAARLARIITRATPGAPTRKMGRAALAEEAARLACRFEDLGATRDVCADDIRAALRDIIARVEEVAW